MTGVLDQAPPDMTPVAAGLNAPGDVLSIEEAASALRVLRHGGVDESTTRFALPPAVRATVSPVIAALRWSAVMFGLVFAAPDANEGDIAVVVSLAIVLFHTTWRTFRPLRLAEERALYRSLAATDALIIGLAIGISGGFVSPFVLCLLAVVAVGAFGWGMAMGAAIFGAGIVGMTITGITTNAGLNLDDRSAAVVFVALLAVLVLLSLARTRLLEIERRRANLAGRLDMLSETNDLLHILNQVARTLPTSLDLREALANTRDQLSKAFDASVVALLVADEDGKIWTPQLTDGCSLPARSTTEELPSLLRQVVDSDTSVLVPELLEPGLGETSATGIYTALRTRGKVVGVLGIEHTVRFGYGDRELRIVDGLAEVLALTVDNARWFRRLRTLGAEEERTRIARDLHDRLGQWLTYISFELERIMSDENAEAAELDHLYGDVQTAIDELRETLRQLRSGVTADKPLSIVAREHLNRFGDRTEHETIFNVTAPANIMSIPIENEMLRILQEALNNVEKHARATRVEVEWQVDQEGGRLTIRDNGRGFDPEHGVRESAYGLVGMRERADSVGAEIEINTSPGVGTEIIVSAPLETRGALA
ncbi:MAG: GAF domain-containing sensor histidine kinase [Acidimicrobiia bacterium]|nr:GAF domain-containing sensor histidine kinase [Acidimicrobiia bacterium]